MPETFLKGFSAIVFSEQEVAEKRSRAPGKPFVDADHRTVVLLDLLFAEGELCGEHGIEMALETHSIQDT
jgi:hypothetical protein